MNYTTFSTAEITRESLQLACAFASQTGETPQFLESIAAIARENLSELNQTESAWYLALLTLGIEQNLRFSIHRGFSFVSPELRHETMRVLGLMMSPELTEFQATTTVLKRVLKTVLRIYAESETDLEAVDRLVRVLSPGSFAELPLIARVKLKAVWVDQWQLLTNSLETPDWLVAQKV